MRRIAFLAIGCLVIAVASARAQAPGVALRWNHCHGEGTGAWVRSFACDTNAGYEELVGSFVAPFDVEQVVGNEIVLNLTTIFYAYSHSRMGPSVPVPDWWRFRNAGSCRQYALSVAQPDPDAEGCPDWSGGHAAILVSGYVADGPIARLSIMSAVIADMAQTLSGGVEYGSFVLRIRHDKTVGDGACGGCAVPLVVSFDSVILRTVSNANDTWLGNGLNGLDVQYVIWKPDVVPTLRTSWGEVKALYR